MTSFFGSMPFDIFEQLCSYLCLADIQNLMLVCKNLYSFSHNKTVTDKILIHVEGDDYEDLDEMSKLNQILNGNRYFSTIKFKQLKLTELLRDFLKKFGLRIRTVIIESVRVKNQTDFFTIFEFMNNIQCFELLITDSVFELFNDNYEFGDDDFQEEKEQEYRDVCDDDAVSIDEIKTYTCRYENINEFHENVNDIDNFENNENDVMELFDMEPDEENANDKYKIFLDLNEIEKINNIFENLVELTLVDEYSNFPKFFVKTFLKKVSKLKKLHIEFWLYGNCNWFYEILEKQIKTLKVLKIIDYRRLVRLPYSYHFENLIRFNELRLKEFHYDCDLLGFKYFDEFCRMQSPYLKKLLFSVNETIPNTFQIICDNLINLKSIEIRYSGEPQLKTGVETLAKLKNLETLNISLLCSGNIKEILKSNNMPNVRCLMCCDISNQETFENLFTNFCNLEELELVYYIEINSIHFNGIQLIFKNLLNLKKISLKFVDMLENENDLNFDSELIGISNLTKLESIKIDSVSGRVPGITVNDISELKNLKEFYFLKRNIYNSTKDEYLKLFTNCCKIEIFVIEQSLCFDDELLKILTINCKMLRKLSISYCSSLTYKSVDYITENCKYLKNVNIHNCYRLRRVKDIRNKFKSIFVPKVRVVFNAAYKWYK